MTRRVVTLIRNVDVPFLNVPAGWETTVDAKVLALSPSSRAVTRDMIAILGGIGQFRFSLVGSSRPSALGPLLVSVTALRVTLFPISGAFKFPSLCTRINEEIRKDAFVTEEVVDVWQLT